MSEAQESAGAQQSTAAPSASALTAMAAGRPGVASGPTAGGTGSPAKPLNAIQIVEQEIGNFFKQREQAVANVHAVDGAIQAAQHLLARLKAEAAKAEVEAKKLLNAAETKIEGIVGDVEAEGKKVAGAVESKVTSIVRDVEAKL